MWIDGEERKNRQIANECEKYKVCAGYKYTDLKALNTNAL